MASSLDDSEQERAINGEIVSKSETENLVEVSEIPSEEGKNNSCEVTHQSKFLQN